MRKLFNTIKENRERRRLHKLEKEQVRKLEQEKKQKLYVEKTKKQQAIQRAEQTRLTKIEKDKEVAIYKTKGITLDGILLIADENNDITAWDWIDTIGSTHNRGYFDKGYNKDMMRMAESVARNRTWLNHITKIMTEQLNHPHDIGTLTFDSKPMKRTGSRGYKGRSSPNGIINDRVYVKVTLPPSRDTRKVHYCCNKIRKQLLKTIPYMAIQVQHYTIPIIYVHGKYGRNLGGHL